MRGQSGLQNRGLQVRVLPPLLVPYLLIGDFRFLTRQRSVEFVPVFWTPSPEDALLESLGLFSKRLSPVLSLARISVELVGEPREGGRVGQRARLCAEAVDEVGFLLAEDFQAGPLTADALLAIGGVLPNCCSYSSIATGVLTTCGPSQDPATLVAVQAEGSGLRLCRVTTATNSRLPRRTQCSSGATSSERARVRSA
jgi:hypothetical protein